MADVREKTLSFRRAEWLNGSTMTLEQCLKGAHGILKSVPERSVARGSQIMRSVKHKLHAGGGILVHITGETPGEFASVVPKPSSGHDEIDLTTEEPPEDGEWLDGDVFLFVKGNDVCLCATGFRDAAIRHFLAELFQKAKVGKDPGNFLLVKAADIGKLKMLQKQGVKELEIRAVMYKATAEYEKRKSSTVGSLGAVGKHIKKILQKPNDVTPDGLKVFLTLKIDRRYGKSSLTLGDKNIRELASDIVRNPDGADDYIIVTKTGQKITQNEIFMKAKALIEADGKTVNCSKAWNVLIKFYDNLHESGALEQ